LQCPVQLQQHLSNLIALWPFFSLLENSARKGGVGGIVISTPHFYYFYTPPGINLPEPIEIVHLTFLPLPLYVISSALFFFSSSFFLFLSLSLYLITSCLNNNNGNNNGDNNNSDNKPSLWQCQINFVLMMWPTAKITLSNSVPNLLPG
jgi:hypothetical protein